MSNSIKLDLYQAVKARLETITSIKKVLHYNNQDGLDYEKDKSRPFPQAWIQLTSIPWDPSSLKVDNSNTTQQQNSDAITLTVYYAAYSLSGDTDTFETDLLSIDEIYRALTMLTGTNFTPLQRISEGDVPNNNNVRVWAQDYTCMLVECGIEEDLVDAAPVTLELEMEYVKAEGLRYSDILDNSEIYANETNILADGI